MASLDATRLEDALAFSAAQSGHLLDELTSHDIPPFNERQGPSLHSTVTKQDGCCSTYGRAPVPRLADADCSHSEGLWLRKLNHSVNSNVSDNTV